MTALEAGIVSTDAVALAAFYVEALGFRLESERAFPQGTVIRLRRGDAGLKIFQPGVGATAASPPEPWHRDAGFAERSEERHESVGEPTRAEVRPHVLLPGSAEPTRFLGVAEKPQRRLGNGAYGRGINDQARLPGPHYLRRGITVTGDDREPVRHGFDEHDSEALFS